jgi:hypothetical protein
MIYAEKRDKRRSFDRLCQTNRSALKNFGRKEKVCVDRRPMIHRLKLQILYRRVRIYPFFSLLLFSSSSSSSGFVSFPREVQSILLIF